MAVQWHPELGWENDEFSQAIFRHFIERVNENSKRRTAAEVRMPQTETASTSK